MFDVQSILWKPLEHLKAFFLALAAIGLLAFLYYSIAQLGMPYGDLELGDALHLAIVAFVVGAYVIGLNVFLLANAALVLKPVLFLLSKLVKRPLRVWRASLLIDAEHPDARGETFEHVYSRSLTWVDFFQFAPLVILLDIFFFFSEFPGSFLDIVLSALFIGVAAGYLIIFINAHSRLSKQLVDTSYFLDGDAQASLELKVAEAKYLSWVFGAVCSLSPLFLMGAGDTIVDSAMSTAGYRADSSNIYVEKDFCPVLMQALESRKSGDAGEYCVFAGVETLLFRIGKEVVVSNPDDENALPVFIPEDRVFVQRVN